MNIKVTQEIDVPSGFYCKYSGKYNCSRIQKENNFTHCIYFNRILAENREGRLVKCQECVEATREQIIKK